MPKYAYGWKPDKPEDRAKTPYLYQHPRALASVPDNVDLSSYFPEVYAQGQLGACTAHMSAAMIQYDQKVQGLDWVMPSRLFDYYNSRLLEGTTSQDAGASISDAVRAIEKYGWVSEDKYPYDIQKFAKRPSQELYTEAQPNKIVDTAYIQQNLAFLQATLAAGHPIGFGFVVYPSFESDHTASTGFMTMPTMEDMYKGPVGGHAVVLVGYQNKRQAFLVRNSWSRSWGINGYFWMPYQYCLQNRLASDFRVINSVPGTKLDFSIVGD